VLFGDNRDQDRDPNINVDERLPNKSALINHHLEDPDNEVAIPDETRKLLVLDKIQRVYGRFSICFARRMTL
jgi:hypothetical protein